MTQLEALEQTKTEAADLEATFAALAEKWKEETAHLSSAAKMAEHPAYQQIIAMGKPVVPLIMRELQHRPDHWFYALRAITGQDPVRSADAGRIPRMTEAWLEYGKCRGYL